MIYIDDSRALYHIKIDKLKEKENQAMLISPTKYWNFAVESRKSHSPVNNFDIRNGGYTFANGCDKFYVSPVVRNDRKNIPY